VQGQSSSAELSSEEEIKEICGLIAELAQQLQDHARGCVADLDVTASQSVALRELNEPLTMRELARRMCCEPSNVTFVVDRLEKQGLVRRREHPQDRRAKELVLTPAGRTSRAHLLDAFRENSPLQHLTEQDRKALHALLRRAVESR
jgi:MarR family transcriptional regulator, organic hydroperoxide resistance regulator